MRKQAPDRVFTAGENRRRSPRFDCTGLANILCLPSDGALLQGMIRNVSQGGCYIETGLVLPCGTLTEILARVDNSCFRALGQVKAVRACSGVCIEFVRLSAGAERMLTELVEYLARVQPVTPVGAAFEREIGRESCGRRELPVGENFPILRTFSPVRTSQAVALVTNPEKKIIEARFVSAPLDLFV